MNKYSIKRGMKLYEEFAKHDKTILGFEYKGQIYIVELDAICNSFVIVLKASSKNGGGLKFNCRKLNNNRKEWLIRCKGAKCIGSSDILVGKYNKGVEFERIVTELYGEKFMGKDNTPFYKDADFNHNGVGYQVKFEGAQIVAFKTLDKLVATM